MFFSKPQTNFTGTLLDAFESPKANNNELSNYNTVMTRERYEAKKLKERKQHESEMLKYYKQYDEIHETNKYHEYKKQLQKFDNEQNKQRVESKLNRIFKIIRE